MKNKNIITVGEQYSRPSCEVLEIEFGGVLCSSTANPTSGFSEKYTYEQV